MNARKSIIQFAVAFIILLLIAAFTVVLFDPFYHYHKPVLGLQAVLDDPEYQCIGSIINFDYDAVILGSSMIENYNNVEFDEAFGVKSVKAVKTSGSLWDLLYYANQAFANHQISKVFYSLDVTSLMNEPGNIFLNDENMPLYLYDNNPVNDINYVLNKDVIFEDIPYMLAMNLTGEANESKSYNFAKYMSFSKEDAINHYVRPEKAGSQMFAPELYEPVVDDNLTELIGFINAHPDTEFIIFIPPYSELWWDDMNRTGIYEESLYVIRTALGELSACENVRMYNFLDYEEVVLNLDYFTDQVHFSEAVNSMIIQELADNQSSFRVYAESYMESYEKTKCLGEAILDRYAKEQ